MELIRQIKVLLEGGKTPEEIALELGVSQQWVEALVNADGFGVAG